MQTTLTYLERVARRAQCDLVLVAFLAGSSGGLVVGAGVGYSLGWLMGYNTQPLMTCLKGAFGS